MSGRKPSALRRWTDELRGKARWRAIFAVRALQSARLMDQPGAFVVADLLPGRHLRSYTMGGRRVRIEHGAGDTWILQELFVDGEYDFVVERPPRRILDVGGNIGMFTLWASMRWPEASIVAFEPDPASIAKHRWVRERNAIAGELIESCAGTRDGVLHFAGGLEGGSHIVNDGSGVVVDAVDVFPYFDGADFVKIDIEGGEWPIITDARFTAIDARDIVLEYHPHLCPGADPRAEARAALEGAGFSVVAMVHDDHTGVGVMRGHRAPAGVT